MKMRNNKAQLSKIRQEKAYSQIDEKFDKKKIYYCLGEGRWMDKEGNIIVHMFDDKKWGTSKNSRGWVRKWENGVWISVLEGKCPFISLENITKLKK